MNSSTVDTNRLAFARAKKENSGAMLDIIRRCVSEVNAADYTQAQVRELLDGFTADWLENIISTRHYYEAWYDGKLVACGGVSRDYSQEKQSYLTAVFVRPDFRKNGTLEGIISISSFVLSLIFFACFVMGDKEQFQNTPLKYEGLWERLTLFCMYIPFVYKSMSNLFF